MLLRVPVNNTKCPTTSAQRNFSRKNFRSGKRRCGSEVHQVDGQLFDVLPQRAIAALRLPWTHVIVSWTMHPPLMDRAASSVGSQDIVFGVLFYNHNDSPVIQHPFVGSGDYKSQFLRNKKLAHPEGKARILAIDAVALGKDMVGFQLPV
ncbi:hypothetical protein NE237_003889 [Protea cynaroides]|uniref:Uncharacterized protein n=1 Tax=Protea cynaroides TaxID=273540 RepID=A0A9Q0KHY4_9MAGN|nr:hypothetical protein NE237_003889 [Protea cynaroides]